MARHKNIHDDAKAAVQQLLEPIAGFSSDCGLSAGEVCQVFREAAIRVVADKQMHTFGRINISGIAASTGITRGEISRVLKVKSDSKETKIDDKRQVTQRILQIWHKNPDYTDSSGRPAILKIYGRIGTFEALAKKYGRGLPTRALLDDLVRLRVVEILPAQQIRAISEYAVDPRVTSRDVRAFGKSGGALLNAMLSNIKDPSLPRYISNVFETSRPLTSLPAVPAELSLKSKAIVEEFQKTIVDANHRFRSVIRARRLVKVIVAIIFYELPLTIRSKRAIEGRRNLHRAKIS